MAALPEAEACAACHPAVVRQWLQHGMADALGPLVPDRLAAQPSEDWIVHAPSGLRHRVEPSDEGWILAQEAALPADGLPPPRREVPLRVRIGAGVQDASFVAVEQGRWFFAPLESLTTSGWTHAPFQQVGTGAGLDFRITADCLACHTDAALPRPFPSHDLQDFTPRGISCAACHGDATAHVRRMRGAEPPAADGDLGVLDPSRLPAARQLDLCARCHLEGDAQLDLAPHAPFRPGDDLLARRIVLVARAPGARPSFVSQVQRLAASACFRASPEMTCTTCHDPHVPPRLQDRARLLAACADCHDAAAHAPLVDAPVGADCATCHMPAVEPFDLPGVRIADHWIRRAPPALGPAEGFREHEAPDGNWKAFRYRASDEPRHDARRVAAVRALARADHGRAEEAAAALADGLPPGLPAAAHFVRARALAAAGRRDAALAGYADAITLDPAHAEAQMNRGWLLLEAGRIPEAFAAAVAVAVAHPRAEAPWLLTASAHAARGEHAAARDAVEQSLARFAAQPELLQRLGRAALTDGDLALARRAFLAAWALEPRLPGLADEVRALR
jgi:Tfp pilus assembly protein PilF